MCLRVCVFTCMCVCVRVIIYPCLCLCVHVCVCLSVSAYVCMSACLCLCVSVSMSVYAYIYTCVSTYLSVMNRTIYSQSRTRNDSQKKKIKTNKRHLPRPQPPRYDASVCDNRSYDSIIGTSQLINLTFIFLCISSQRDE